ncbi:hypothetical protein L842_2331 [Mycobacterium intracellulare MIN_052511_1280]|nr:hypothetical protein L842_2331 [Mycobacterium intracellulare MIN_052511_1280]
MAVPRRPTSNFDNGVTLPDRLARVDHALFSIDLHHLRPVRRLQGRST